VTPLVTTAMQLGGRYAVGRPLRGKEDRREIDADRQTDRQAAGHRSCIKPLRRGLKTTSQTKRNNRISVLDDALAMSSSETPPGRQRRHSGDGRWFSGLQTASQ